MEMEIVDKDPNYTATTDFQAWDEAWYSVRLVLEGEVLVVKYVDFSDKFDNVFGAAEFKNSKQVDDFAKRFRPISVQLQDKECCKIVQGTTVCASFTFGKDDVRFYDAVVMEIKGSKHKFGEEEECTCTFILYWLRGPNAMKETTAVVADICLLQPGNGQIEPTLSLFLELCREKIKLASEQGDALVNPNEAAIVIYKDSAPRDEPPPSHVSKEVTVYKHSVSTARKFRGRSTNHWETDQDNDFGRESDQKDLGDTSSLQFILIENLEVDLAPSTIVDFVRKYASITSRAQVFPSSSWNSSYTRGVIVVDSKVDRQKLYDFLQNPTWMILSSRGRPWMITQKTRCVSLGETMKNLAMLPESRLLDRSPRVGDDLKIVSKGTEEYMRGMQLKDLYLEFAEHQHLLQQRLAFEEGRILEL